MARVWNLSSGGRFRNSAAWGFVSLFIPLGLLIFLALHFDEAPAPALLFVAGIALFVMMYGWYLLLHGLMLK